jgi:hypothetical protein
MLTALPWILVVLLLLAALPIALLARRRRLGAAAAIAEREQLLAAQSAEHDRSLRAAADAHGLAMTRLERIRTEERAALEGEARTALADAEAARERLAATWGHEAASHVDLRTALSAAGLRGLLATNVVFPWRSAAGDAFVHQLDHVVVVPRGVLGVENKRWRGVVFDGVPPRSVHESFAQLVDDDSLVDEDGRVGSFAVQIARLSSSPASPERIVRCHVGRAAPAAQARRQAADLRARLGEQGVALPWCDTAVYYSHPGASLHVRREDVTARGASTRIIAGPADLAVFARDLARSSERRIDEGLAARLSELFASAGAHVDRIGPDVARR